MRLPPIHVEKVWGLDLLPAPFATAADKRIGEIWFEPPPALSEILVKYIFAGEKLSVQCHPNDAQAAAAGYGTNGKDECWLVIDAEKGAKLGIAFEEAIGTEAMHSAVLDGSIEDLLAWHDVVPGDFFYIPANTVHAIGGGVSIIEIQQNSDITYRLYDYGRPRQLHLDEGLRVASGAKFDTATHQKVPRKSSVTLVEGPYFRLDQVAGAPDEELRNDYSEALLVMPREGVVRVTGNDIAAGECAIAGSIDEIGFAGDGVCLLAAPTRKEPT